ncbi:HD domain-containing protein [Candidatus Gracilibacteria bacterium]|nr:HD domain-containing protein [Candidatus Gracilibacteria bacterium]
MNEKIISGIKKYVNQMMGPLEDHYYHQYEHALEVAERSLEVGKKEGLPEEELELLYIASLFHDVGFVIQYDNNEIIGATIAKNYLKSILYPEDKIKIIEELIISTTLEIEPKNLLEKIIKDADMDNLGRVDFFEKGEKLKHELELIKKIKILDPDWSHYSLNLLKSHNFYTNTGINERNLIKSENIKILENKINN